ncbi:MAG: hypothetical protein ACRCWY_10185 [Cellulosilyticaceae bacterium]
METKKLKKIMSLLMILTLFLTGTNATYALAPTRQYTETFAPINLPDGGKATIQITFEQFIGFLEIELPIPYDEEGGTVIRKEKFTIPVIRQAKGDDDPMTTDSHEDVFFEVMYEGPAEELMYYAIPSFYYYDKDLGGFVSDGQYGEASDQSDRDAIAYWGSGLTDAIMQYTTGEKDYFYGGYPFVLLLTEADEAYFKKHGCLYAGDAYTWPGLRELLGVPASKPVLKQAMTTSTTSKILVNGKVVEVESYNIEGSNYFKLRDLAWLLKNTEKNFDIGWNEAAKAITLMPQTPYSTTENQLRKGDGVMRQAVMSDATIYREDTQVYLKAYTIEGSNYFKLRDLGSALGFHIGWDEAQKVITIDTTKGYTF